MLLKGKGSLLSCCVLRSKSLLLIRGQPVEQEQKWEEGMKKKYVASPGWTSRSGCPGYAKLFSLDLMT